MKECQLTWASFYYAYMPKIIFFKQKQKPNMFRVERPTVNILNSGLRTKGYITDADWCTFEFDNLNYFIQVDSHICV